MSSKLSIGFLCLLMLGLYTPIQAQTDWQDRMVAKVNEFRATLNLPDLKRWREGESCAETEAKLDSEANAPHQSWLGKVCGGEEVRAQNTFPNWPSIDQMIDQGLQHMWDEGPAPEPCDQACMSAHAHYMNIANPAYSWLAVGAYKNANGQFWVNMNFK